MTSNRSGSNRNHTISFTAGTWWDRSETGPSSSANAISELVHSQCLVKKIEKLTECPRHLKPGGWVEFQDTTNRLYSEDGTLDPENNVLKLMNGLIDACGRIGIPGDFAPRIKGELEKAGFVNVQEKIFKVPVGPWPKDKRLASLPNFDKGYKYTCR